MPSEPGNLAFAVLLLVLCANLLSRVCARIRQPRVVGEILAGVLLGPTVFGEVAPGLAARVFGTSGTSETALVLDGLYQLGLLLLMFLAGASVQHVLGRQDRRPAAWLLAIGTPVPFLAAVLVGLALPLESIAGPADNRSALILVLGVAAAVTSIPVLTRIFQDLGVLHTRLASLVLGVAVLEDTALWAVVAVATAIAGEQAVGRDVWIHAFNSLAFVAVGMTVAPAAVRRLSHARWNTLASDVPVAWAVIVLAAYACVASALHVTTVFAAFLAGFAIVGGSSGSERVRMRVALDPLSQVGGAIFIPLAFALVGYRLQLGRGFSPLSLVIFLFGSTAVCVLAIAVAARAAGFRGVAVTNLALAMNARGGPGIVLASVALDEGIVNGSFFTTLVITSVVTSQVFGVWLDYVLRRGWPLLDPSDRAQPRDDDARPDRSAIHDR
jgi:Kef-type K+ transport system membrane component KefB